MEKMFVYKTKYKAPLIVLMIVGLISLIVGMTMYKDQSVRIWANLLLNNFVFLAAALFGTFFIVIHVLGNAGWHVTVQRVAEAMGTYLPVSAVIMLLIFVFGMHDLFHWSHTGHLDEILEAKTPYLNQGFFYIRFAVYFAGWIILTYLIRKTSLQQDFDADLKHHSNMLKLSGIFIVFFAITSSTAAWDWLMSLDAHWFSTLFGWYIFSGLFVIGISVMILIVLFLRKIGAMDYINEEHLHDLGKYLFAFSIFWMYLWFSQFMLIWYSNIPEETIYFVERLNHYPVLFYVNLGLNFLAPFLILMTRGSKRIHFPLALAAVICLVGHWIDYYLVVIPSVMGHEGAHIGLFEIGLALGFVGLFGWFVLRSVSKVPVLPKNHPYLKESFEYDNI